MLETHGESNEMILDNLTNVYDTANSLQAEHAAKPAEDDGNPQDNLVAGHGFPSENGQIPEADAAKAVDVKNTEEHSNEHLGCRDPGHTYLGPETPSAATVHGANAANGVVLIDDDDTEVVQMFKPQPHRTQG